MNKIIILCLPVFLMAAIHMTAKPKLYIIGDSTACIYPSSQYPRTGWAQVLQNYFNSDSVQVADSALSGRSSKSFYDEGHWTPIKNTLRKGDCVVIQFGHNDEKTDDAARGTIPATSFKQYLSIYIDDAIAKGATPILATPIERNSWSGAAIKSTHVTADGDYPQAIRDLAGAKKIGLIDATKLTKAFLEKIGKDSATQLFLNLEAGKWPNYPDGNTDNTHLRETGAKTVAQLIVGDIARQGIQPLSRWLVPGTTATQPSAMVRSSPPLIQSSIAFGRNNSSATPKMSDLLGRTFSIGAGNRCAGGCMIGRRGGGTNGLYFYKFELDGRLVTGQMVIQ
jgi:lysophospholipase L1-like esterase